MNDEDYMRIALSEAEKAVRRDEVPVGAVLVKDGKILVKAHNRREKRQDATAHAELLCIRRACRKMKSWRLEGCTLYVTLEPCPMCAGAAVNARIKEVVFGACDRNAGACGTQFEILGKNILNHVAAFRGGVLAKECADILTGYFKKKRKNAVK